MPLPSPGTWETTSAFWPPFLHLRRDHRTPKTVSPPRATLGHGGKEAVCTTSRPARWARAIAQAWRAEAGPGVPELPPLAASRQPPPGPPPAPGGAAPPPPLYLRARCRDLQALLSQLRSASRHPQVPDLEGVGRAGSVPRGCSHAARGAAGSPLLCVSVRVWGGSRGEGGHRQDRAAGAGASPDARGNQLEGAPPLRKWEQEGEAER